MTTIKEKQVSHLVNSEADVYLDQTDTSECVDALVEILLRYELSFNECFDVLKDIYQEVGDCRPCRL